MNRIWTVYLAGEIHSDWRETIRADTKSRKLPIEFYSPVTDHASSDDCGDRLISKETKEYWRDHKGALINSMRTRTLLSDADIVVVRFGDKYRQWNAAFDAGMAAALGKPLIVIHPPAFGHALKEIDAAAAAVVEEPEQVGALLDYVVSGELAPV